VGKGDMTRGSILGSALALASETGLEGVSIGALAERVGMSKSGLFAHFQSKEGLQLAILETGITHFIARVVTPALKEPRGEPRVRALIERWIVWAEADIMPGGCIFVSSIAELDDRPGIVRDRLAASQRDWLDTLTTAIRIAVDEKHFRKSLVPEQLAHELLTLFYGHHLISRLLRDPKAEKRTRVTMERLLADARTKSS
jgi:AcrR family transcriptional regulator